MGTVYRKTFTKPLPAGAEVFIRKGERFARDETAARRVLGELERRGELVKSGVMTAAEDAIADHQSTPLETHLAACTADCTN